MLNFLLVCTISLERMNEMSPNLHGYIVEISSGVD